jgi:hypothetical protein
LGDWSTHYVPPTLTPKLGFSQPLKLVTPFSRLGQSAAKFKYFTETCVLRLINIIPVFVIKDVRLYCLSLYACSSIKNSLIVISYSYDKLEAHNLGG